MGQAPTIFTGRRDDAAQFMSDLENYHFLNRHSPIITDETTRVSHALTLIKGAEVDGWVRQRLKWLQQISQGLIQDNNPWESFRERFLLDYSDITAAQRAHVELSNLRMGAGGVDAYIVKFEELASKAGCDLEDPSTCMRFWTGLPPPLLQECLRERPQPVTWDEWKRAVRTNYLNYQVTKNIMALAHRQRTGGASEGGKRRPFFVQQGSGFFRPQSQRQQPPPRSRGTETIPMDIDRLHRNVTDAEKAQLSKEGQCFECRHQGHLARNCPPRRSVLTLHASPKHRKKNPVSQTKDQSCPPPRLYSEQ